MISLADMLGGSVTINSPSDYALGPRRERLFVFGSEGSVVLPDARNLELGGPQFYLIASSSSNNHTVKYNDGTTYITNVGQHHVVILLLVGNTTQNGEWRSIYRDADTASGYDGTAWSGLAEEKDWPEVDRYLGLVAAGSEGQLRNSIGNDLPSITRSGVLEPDGPKVHIGLDDPLSKITIAEACFDQHPSSGDDHMRVVENQSGSSWTSDLQSLEYYLKEPFIELGPDDTTTAVPQFHQQRGYATFHPDRRLDVVQFSGDDCVVADYESGRNKTWTLVSWVSHKMHSYTAEISGSVFTNAQEVDAEPLYLYIALFPPSEDYDTYLVPYDGNNSAFFGPPEEDPLLLFMGRFWPRQDNGPVKVENILTAPMVSQGCDAGGTLDCNFSASSTMSVFFREGDPKQQYRATDLPYTACGVWEGLASKQVPNGDDTALVDSVAWVRVLWSDPSTYRFEVNANADGSGSWTTLYSAATVNNCEPPASSGADPGDLLDSPGTTEYIELALSHREQVTEPEMYYFRSNLNGSNTDIRYRLTRMPVAGWGGFVWVQGILAHPFEQYNGANPTDAVSINRDVDYEDEDPLCSKLMLSGQGDVLDGTTASGGDTIEVGDSFTTSFVCLAKSFGIVLDFAAVTQTQIDNDQAEEPTFKYGPWTFAYAWNGSLCVSCCGSDGTTGETDIFIVVTRIT